MVFIFIVTWIFLDNFVIAHLTFECWLLCLALVWRILWFYRRSCSNSLFFIKNDNKCLSHSLTEMCYHPLLLAICTHRFPRKFLSSQKVGAMSWKISIKVCQIKFISIHFVRKDLLAFQWKTKILLLILLNSDFTRHHPLAITELPRVLSNTNFISGHCWWHYGQRIRNCWIQLGKQHFSILNVFLY